jgi:hypothetical protein
MEYTKLDDTTMQVTNTLTESTTYTLDTLKASKASILKRKSDFSDVCDSQIADIQVLIDQAEALGIKSAIDAALDAEQARVDTAQGGKA